MFYEQEIDQMIASRRKKAEELGSQALYVPLDRILSPENLRLLRVTDQRPDLAKGDSPTQAELAETTKLSEISVKNIERGVADPRAGTPSALVETVQGAGVEFINGDPPGVQRHAWRWFVQCHKRYRTRAERVCYFADFGSMLRGLSELKKEFPPPEHRLRVRGPLTATEEQRKAIEREDVIMPF